MSSDLKWWVFDQNNSGGYMIRNEDVDDYVAIQASSKSEAQKKAYEIFEDYSEYCECCGERWSVYYVDDEGTDVPEIYGEPLYEVTKGYCRENVILYYADGTKEKYKFKEGTSER